MNKSDLELLGYSEEWLEDGWLTPELLSAQVASFRAGEDESTEHYRYTAFQIVQDRETFSDLEVERYMDLAAMDPDLVMATAALVDLLRHRGLTEEQWEVVMVHPLVQQMPRLVKQERLLKELRHPDPTEETVQRCVSGGDGVVQRGLLALPDLPRQILEALHERGATRAVRNLAGIRLKREP